MKHRFLNLFTAVCLVLALATADSRGHNHLPSDDLHIQTVSFSPPTISIHQLEIWSAEGVLFFSLHTITIFPISPQEMEIDRAALDAASANGNFTWNSTPTTKTPSDPAIRSDTLAKSLGFSPQPHNSDWIAPSKNHTVRESSLQFSIPSRALLLAFLLFPIYWLTRRPQNSPPAYAQ